MIDQPDSQHQHIKDRSHRPNLLEEEEHGLHYRLNRDKHEWTPQYIKSIDEELASVAAAAYKVCAHDVLAFEELDEDDSAKMFMKMQPGNCIGCQACGRTCSKKCFSFEPVCTVTLRPSRQRRSTAGHGTKEDSLSHRRLHPTIRKENQNNSVSMPSVSRLRALKTRDSKLVDAPRGQVSARCPFKPRLPWTETIPPGIIPKHAG